eukprot:366403-Chlamydomonas_euryale.AAC.7
MREPHRENLRMYAAERGCPIAVSAVVVFADVAHSPSVRLLEAKAARAAHRADAADRLRDRVLRAVLVHRPCSRNVHLSHRARAAGAARGADRLRDRVLRAVLVYGPRSRYVHLSCGTSAADAPDADHCLHDRRLLRIVRIGPWGHRLAASTAPAVFVFVKVVVVRLDVGADRRSALGEQAARRRRAAATGSASTCVAATATPGGGRVEDRDPATRG